MTSKSSVSKKNSVVLVAFLVLCLASSSAWAAKKRIVVTRFAGKGDYAQKIATDVVGRDSIVVSDGQWVRAMKRLKLKSTTTPESTAKVAAALKADGIVSGSVQRAGKSWSVTITVTDGKTGQATDTLDIPLKSYRVDNDARKAIATQLAAALAKLGGEAPVEITPEATGPSRPPEVDTESAPIGKAAPPPVETYKSEPPADTGAGSPADDGRYSRSRAAEITVGIGIIGRKLDFDAASDLSAAQAPRGYSGSAVPSVVVEGELYPFAFGSSSSSREGALAGLGLGFELERVLSISSKLGDVEYDTSQMRVGGGLRYRVNFGQSATAPTLKFMAGVNHLEFSVDRGGADLGFANVSYTYIDLGAHGRLPLGTPKISLYLGLRYLQVLDSGEINETAFYGSGGALGFDGEIGLEYLFLRRGMIRLGGRYQRFALDFDGNGTLSNNRDGNSATQDVGGATDQFFGGYLTVGYLF